MLFSVFRMQVICDDWGMLLVSRFVKLIEKRLFSCVVVDELSTTGKGVSGDRNARQVLDCLVSVSVLYGESTILLQYFPFARELVSLTLQLVCCVIAEPFLGCLIFATNLHSPKYSCPWSGEENFQLLKTETTWDILQRRC